MPRPNLGRIKASIAINSELWDRISVEAAKRKVTKSDAMEAGLKYWLKGSVPAPEDQLAAINATPQEREYALATISLLRENNYDRVEMLITLLKKYVGALPATIKRAKEGLKGYGNISTIGTADTGVPSYGTSVPGIEGAPQNEPIVDPGDQQRRGPARTIVEPEAEVLEDHEFSGEHKSAEHAGDRPDKSKISRSVPPKRRHS